MGHRAGASSQRLQASVIGEGRSPAAIAARSDEAPDGRIRQMDRLRFLLLAVVASVALLGSLPASAAEWKPFDAAAFAQAQKDGKPILVDIFAAWCPVCRAQNPILPQMTREPKFDDLVV